MRTSNLKNITCVFAFLASTLVAGTSTVSADGFLSEKVYQIEVQYDYWPVGYLYWTTFIETTDESEAYFIFAILETARKNDYLADLLDASGRHIPVDVRMTTYRRRIPLPLHPIAKHPETPIEHSRLPHKYQLFD